MLIAIDPGPTRSAVVPLVDDNDGTLPLPEMHSALLGMHENGDLLRSLADRMHKYGDRLLIEDVRCYGMPVGVETFETVKMIGAIRLLASMGGNTYVELGRPDIKLALCGSVRAKDANVRQRLIELYGPTKERAVGCKRTPGPLYAIRTHLWSALAVGVAYKSGVCRGVPSNRSSSDKQRARS